MKLFLIMLFGVFTLGACSCGLSCQHSKAKAQSHGNILCYGQHVPICSLNYKPVCVCSTGTADLCAYVCMPK